jgi:hypothetical protein
VRFHIDGFGHRYRPLIAKRHAAARSVMIAVEGQ